MKPATDEPCVRSMPFSWLRWWLGICWGSRSGGGFSARRPSGFGGALNARLFASTGLSAGEAGQTRNLKATLPHNDGRTPESPPLSGLMAPIQGLLSSAQPLLRLDRILVPINFSESSLRALPSARFLLRQFGCTVTMLHAVHINIVGEERGIPLDRFQQEMKSAAEQTLRETAAFLKLSPARIVVRIEDPLSAILHEAAESEVDLIIIGEQPRPGLSRFFGTSLARKVISRAPCHTLVAS